MPGFPLVPAPPPPQGGQGIGIGVPLAPPPPPASNGACTPSIIGSLVWRAGPCCVFFFWLNCPGLLANFSIQATNADEGSVPDYDFFPESQDDSGIVGFLPGYPYLATVPGDDRTGWAASCMLVIRDLAGGFSDFEVICDTYDLDTGAISGTTGASFTTGDISSSLSCPSNVQGCTINVSAGGNFIDPAGLTSTPNRVWLFFVPGDGSPGCSNSSGTGDISRAITDGSITSVMITDGITKRPDPSGSCAEGQCFADKDGCTPSISDADTFDTITITGPISLTEDSGNPGWWYIDADTLGLWDVGASTPLTGVCNINITTNLGTCACIVAHSSAI